MKKSLKVLFISLMIVLTTTSCVKMNMSMEINKDKSMNFVLVEAFNEILLKQYNDDSIFKEKDLKQYKENGFKVEKYSESSMIGYKFSKTFKNIDKISSDKNVKADLNSEMSNLFIIKKGVFKNTYKANFSSSNSNKITDEVKDKTDDESNNNFDYSSMMSGMEMKFVVKLPYKVLSTNATEVNDDGKKLTWNLLELTDSDNGMQFEFELYNMTNIYIAIIVVILLIVASIILIISSIKNKNSINSNVQPNTPVQEQEMPNNNQD